MLPEGPDHVFFGHVCITLDIIGGGLRVAVENLRISQVADFTRNALHAEDLAGLEPRDEFLQVVIVHAALGKLTQCCTDRFLHLGQRLTRCRVLDHDESHFAGQFAAGVADVSAHSTARLHQTLVEQGGAAHTDDLGGCVQRRLVRMAVVDGREQHRDRRQVDIVFQRDVTVLFETAGLPLQVFGFGTAWNGAEIPGDPLQCFLLVDIATDRQRGVVRSVPAQEEALQVIQFGGVQILDPTDHRPGIRMVRRIQVLHHRFVGAPIRPVVHPLPTLVLDRGALGVELLLGHCFQQQAHAVGFQPQRRFQLVDGHCLEVVGPVGIG